ncbi:MAG: kelch repeat-containing protein, partial [Saprospiraceae bacterium]|nr:kelch repeat-containing protein [Saprospiraceae bacterium]
SSVHKYDIATNTWLSCADLPVPTCRFAAVTWGGRIYLFGGLAGSDDRNCTNTAAVYVFDPVANTWARLTDMPTARHGHSAVLVNSKILVVGGYTQGPVGLVEEYDPAQDTWSTKADMPTARGFFGLVNLRDQVYALAGRVKDDAAPVEQYDPIRNLWTQLEPLPVPRQRFGIAAIHDTVYLIGGERNPKSMLVGELRQWKK